MTGDQLQGIYSPIATAFDDSGALALDELRWNVRRWNESDLSGFVVMGSNGEFPHLTDEEQVMITRAVAEEVSADKYLIAGTGTPSTESTVKRTERAAESGADAAMVLPPYYYRPGMGERELEEHYVHVAETSPIPIILYNIPLFAAVELDVTLVAKLSHHPNIIGLKDSGGNVMEMGRCVVQSADGFSVMAGSAGYLLPAMSMGCSGGVVALGNIAPNECVRLHELVRDGEWEKAKDLQAKVLPLVHAVTTQYGISGLKAAMDLLGYYGGNPRPPLLPLGQEGRGEIERLLSEFGLL